METKPEHPVQSRRSANALANIARTVLALWAVTAIVRMAFVMPLPGWPCWVGVPLLLLIFLVWGIGRRVRTGRLPTEDEETAVIQKFGGPFWQLFGGAVLGAYIAGFIMLVELNDLFSRQALERAVGEYPVLFWATVFVGMVVGLGVGIWDLNRTRGAAAVQGSIGPDAEKSDEPSRNTE